MPRTLFAGLACTLALSFVSITGGVTAQEGDTIEGTWVPANAELGGKPFPDEIRKAMKLEVKDDKYTVTVGQIADKGTLKVNPKAKPKEIDITGTDGPN